MIETIRDNEGRLMAVCEWLLFQDGKLDRQGDTLFVSELEVNPDIPGGSMIKHFMRALYQKNPQAKRLVFLREYKYPGRDYRTYTREQVAKRIGE